MAVGLEPCCDMGDATLCVLTVTVVCVIVSVSLNDVKSSYLSSPHATAVSLIDGELCSASGTLLKCDNCRERGLRCVYVPASPSHLQPSRPDS